MRQTITPKKKKPHFQGWTRKAFNKDVTQKVGNLHSHKFLLKTATPLLLQLLQCTLDRQQRQHKYWDHCHSRRRPKVTCGLLASLSPVLEIVDICIVNQRMGEINLSSSLSCKIVQKLRKDMKQNDFIIYYILHTSMSLFCLSSLPGI